MQVLLKSHDLPLRGRSTEAARIREAFRLARDAGSVLLTVEGAPGTGKSRMLCEAGRIAEEHGATVVNGLPTGDETVGRPLAVLLDDVYCTGEAEARALAALRGRYTDTPTVWCTARRAGWANGPADNVLGTMTAVHEHLRLGPLPQQAVRALATDVLGAEPDAALDRALADAGGVPHAVKTLLEGWGEEGLIEIGTTARLTADVLPERIRDLVQWLSYDCSDLGRRMLRMAAAMDRHIAFEELAAVLDTSPSDLLPALDEAVATGLVRSVGGELAFASTLFWRVICESMPVTVRTALRQQAEQKRPPSSGSDDPGFRSAAERSADMQTGARPVRAARRPHAHRGQRPHRQRGRSLPAVGACLPTTYTAEAAGPSPADGRSARAPMDAPGKADAEPTKQQPSGWESLTDRQRAIVRLAVRGMTNRQIADEIYASPHTINYHLRKIYRALSISSRVDLLRVTHEHGAARGG